MNSTETRIIHKAKKGEYPAYAEMYMKLLPDDGRILEHLWTNFLEIKQCIAALPEDKLLFKYAPNKWTIKEVLVHIVDDERIFAYRALRFARGEQQNLIGFDQDAYAQLSEANSRSIEGIFEEYESVRKATISLFKYLPEASLDRMGHGTGTFNDATVRALAYHIAGHEWHHFLILKDQYLI